MSNTRPLPLSQLEISRGKRDRTECGRPSRLRTTSDLDSAMVVGRRLGSERESIYRRRRRRRHRPKETEAKRISQFSSIYWTFGRQERRSAGRIIIIVVILHVQSNRPRDRSPKICVPSSVCTLQKENIAGRRRLTMWSRTRPCRLRPLTT